MHLARAGGQVGVPRRAGAGKSAHRTGEHDHPHPVGLGQRREVAGPLVGLLLGVQVGEDVGGEQTGIGGPPRSRRQRPDRMGIGHRGRPARPGPARDPSPGVTKASRNSHRTQPGPGPGFVGPGSARPQFAEVDEGVAGAPALQEAVDRRAQVDRRQIGGVDQPVAVDRAVGGRDVREASARRRRRGRSRGRRAFAAAGRRGRSTRRSRSGLPASAPRGRTPRPARGPGRRAATPPPPPRRRVAASTSGRSSPAAAGAPSRPSAEARPRGCGARSCPRSHRRRSEPALGPLRRRQVDGLGDRHVGQGEHDQLRDAVARVDVERLGARCSAG